MHKNRGGDAPRGAGIAQDLWWIILDNYKDANHSQTIFAFYI